MGDFKGQTVNDPGLVVGDPTFVLNVAYYR